MRVASSIPILKHVFRYHIVFWVCVAFAACLAFGLGVLSAYAQQGPEDSDLALANGLHSEALKLYEEGKYAEAEQLYERSLAILEKALGPEHPDVATSLNNLAVLCEMQGKYARAESLYERSLAIREKALGPEHPDVATSLNNVGLLYQSQEKYAEAEPLLKRALEILEKARGPDHPDVAVSLNNLATLYDSQGEYAKAEPLYERALAIKERTLGRDHPDVAGSLNNLALVYQTQAKYAEARPLYERALAIRQKALGPEHPDVAQSLNNLAGLCELQGRYAEAVELYKRSLAIWEKALGPEHPDVATSLNNLALVYQTQAKYAEAEPLYERSLAIRQKALGPDHPDVAESLGNLALLYHSQGRHAEAVPLYKRSLAIKERFLGPEHPDVATSLNNLALLYHSQGRYAEAEPLYKRAVAISEKALGLEHPNVATSLSNLADVYAEQGKYAEAEPLYERSLAIREKALGTDHPDVAASLNNLALLYKQRGKNAEAEPLFKRAVAISERALGPEHPHVATSLNNLAALYYEMGRLAEAEPVYKRSLAIKEKTLGSEHPDVATSLNNLATLYYSQAKYAEAEPLYRRAVAINERALGPEHPLVATSLNNLAALAFATGKLEEAWTYARRARQVVLAARQRAATSALARSSFQAERLPQNLLPCLALKLHKGVDVLELVEQGEALALRELLAEARAQTASVLPEKDRERVMEALGRVNSLNSRIEKAASKGQPVEALRYELQRAEMDYESVMAELRDRQRQFVDTETARGITSAEVAKSPVLNDTTAIVGWVEFGDWAWGYVVRMGGVNWVELSSVTKASQDAELVQRILSACREPGGRTPPVKDLVELYRRRFAPLQAHLGGVERLIIVAQGWAAILPVEMLLTSEPTGRDMAEWPWLCERYEISYTPSVTTLDIICRQRRAGGPKRWERPLFALADPPFSKEQLAQMQSAEVHVAGGPSLAEATGGGDPSLALRQLVRFDPKATPVRLLGTRREVELLAALVGPGNSLLLVGPDATERKLFEASATGRLAKCRYIHLATHGVADGERPELSSLVLARVPEDPDYDGMLQMREVFHLKLDADLVVLSACQTGLGKQLRGEGMVGLSTAFLFAGTPSLVMSLWNVPDVSTALLMRRFYENLLAGQNKAAALREAKSWLRDLPRSEIAKLENLDPRLHGATRGLSEGIQAEKGELAGEKPFSHPHYWAPFVVTGDPQR